MQPWAYSNDGVPERLETRQFGPVGLAVPDDRPVRLDRSERTSIVTCRVDGWNSMEVVQELKKRKIVAHKRQEFVRFSPHLYNSAADVDRAIAELQSLLKG